MRFGIGDGRAHTLKEVGQKFSLTGERIRQVEAKALRKLRGAGLPLESLEDELVSSAEPAEVISNKGE